jgi:hypothetical protein
MLDMTDTAHPVRRWGQAILAILQSPEDIRTVDAWSRYIGLSSTQLRTQCRLVGVSAKDSLDLARLLRALLHQEVTGWPLAYFLNVSDDRTLDRLTHKRSWSEASSISAAERFIKSQRIVTIPVAVEELLNCVSLIRNVAKGQP